VQGLLLEPSLLWPHVRIRYGALGPAALCRRGLRQVYRLRPERPGDEPHAKSEVLAVTPSKSRPKRLIKVRTTTLNQNGETVQVFVANLIVPRRVQQGA